MAERYQWIEQKRAGEELFTLFPELHPVVVQLLANRGMTTQEEVDEFLMPDYGQDQYDPFQFREMEKVLERIEQAREKGERVVVHGDYDADGVCATAVLVKTLKKIGIEAEIYIPHRDTEGYGLNLESVQSFADKKTDLIITVDCGISNKPEIEKAVELGMEVIVTDHHSQPTELPDKACAILNPKIEGETYPFKELAGVGVAFKLCQALIRRYELGEAFEKWMLDLVALSTVTDYVELIGENRVFVKYGLIVMKKNQRPGLRQLFETAGIDVNTIDTETIMFKIGPRINAAGRVRHANVAYDLIVEEDMEKALEMAVQIDKTNKERQAMSESMTKQAMEQAERQKGNDVIFVEKEGWPLGLTGLVAGHLSGKFNRPAFVLTNMEDEIVGSGRSIEQFNMIEALQEMDELFRKYGGHPQACGFSLKSQQEVAEFKERIAERATQELAGKDLRKTLHIEYDLELKDIDWPLLQALEQFEPHGEGNQRPIFVSRGVEVKEFTCVGKTKDHLRIQLMQDGVVRKGIGFGCGSFAEKLATGDTVDVAYTLGVNEWNGNREIQMTIKDIELPS